MYKIIFFKLNSYFACFTTVAQMGLTWIPCTKLDEFMFMDYKKLEPSVECQLRTKHSPSELHLNKELFSTLNIDKYGSLITCFLREFKMTKRFNITYFISSYPGIVMSSQSTDSYFGKICVDSFMSFPPNKISSKYWE